MNLIEHPIEFEICERSGQVPWECGLNACDNGCTTRTVEFVPLSQHRGAVEEVERLRTWIGTEGRYCPSSTTIHEVLMESKKRVPPTSGGQ